MLMDSVFSLFCPGVHDDEDPEYSILKSRMVNKMKEEGLSVSCLQLLQFNSVTLFQKGL